MTYIASFDIGTTNVKGVLVDRSASILHESNVSLEVSHVDGFVEQDPESWYRAIADIAREWFRAGVSPDRIALLSFSGQMQDCIPVRADGTAVRPAILYSDGRGAPYAERLLAELGEETIVRETENHMDGTLTLPKIMWLRENEADVYRETASFLISAKDYAIARLTGAFVTDPTSAATAGCMNIRTRSWMTGWLERFGLEPSKLPKIIPSDAVAGEIHAQGAADTGFAAGTPVLCGIGDAGSATLGAGVYREGEAYAYIGTTGWVAAASSGFMDVRSGAFNLAYVENGLQISIAPMTNAGSAHKWAAGVFGSAPASQGPDGSLDFQAFDEAVARADRRSGVLFLPYLNGERCPVQDVHASGSFIGLRTTTTKEQMGAAVLEGVAFAIRQVMELVVGRDAELRVTLIGGGAKSKAWCRIISDVLQCELVVPDDSQYLPSIGAAVLGFPKLGWGEDFEALCGMLKAGQSVETFKPNRDFADYYGRQFDKYKRMYAQLAPLYEMP